MFCTFYGRCIVGFGQDRHKLWAHREQPADAFPVHRASPIDESRPREALRLEPRSPKASGRHQHPRVDHGGERPNLPGRLEPIRGEPMGPPKRPPLLPEHEDPLRARGERGLQLQRPADVARPRSRHEEHQEVPQRAHHPQHQSRDSGRDGHVGVELPALEREVPVRHPGSSDHIVDQILERD